jgi:hypothetical protein
VHAIFSFIVQTLGSFAVIVVALRLGRTPDAVGSPRIAATATVVA